MVPEYFHDTGRQLSEILVPTVDTVKTTWLLKLMNEVRITASRCSRGQKVRGNLLLASC
jgi:hypothetical protein